MSRPPALAELIEDLSLFPDRQDRIEALISLGRRFRNVGPEVVAAPYDESHRVPGCESEAFVWSLPQPDGTMQYHFAVQNPQGISAMALAVILQDSLNGQPPQLAQGVDEEVVYEIFGRELSMGKSGGLMNMIRLLKTQAATV